MSSLAVPLMLKHTLPTIILNIPRLTSTTIANMKSAVHTHELQAAAVPLSVVKLTKLFSKNTSLSIERDITPSKEKEDTAMNNHSTHVSRLGLRHCPKKRGLINSGSGAS